MRILPRNNASRITFCLLHAAKWAQNAAELGLDPLKVAELQDRIEAARLAFNAQRQAQSAARSATLNMNLALEAMDTLTATLIKQIRATAAQDGDAAYSLAQISPPEKRSPIGKPGMPTRFTAELQQSGWLVLRWTCKNPRGAVGTMYQVHRQLRFADGSVSAKQFLGVTGTKEFTDSTIPPGCAAVTYHVQAVRSTAVGVEANHNVNFGSTFRVNAPGQMQIAA